MRYLLFICTFFPFCGSVAFGQAAIKTDFESFATDQNRLFVAAYQQKDTRAFHRLLDEFLARYNQLSESDKKKYPPTTPRPFTT